MIGNKKGMRCIVCTGCGRCPGVVRQMHVVTERLEKTPVNLHNEEGLRLITVDVGTTTVAMQLHREDGSVEDSFAEVNPQTKYGADVLSRILAAEKREAAEEMRCLIFALLKKGIERFQRKMSLGEKAVMVLAANTTMVYLLMGWDTAELGRAPFAASHLEGTKTDIAGVPCYIFPGLSAFVGGDIVAGIHACGLLHREKPMLLIDLGTNGEMALGERSRLYACATAAGPAFEGGVNAGRWGSDMVSLIAEMRRQKLLDEAGLIAEPYFTSGVRIGDVCVTQEAVRAIQLAKAAIAAGIKILCQQYGCSPDEIERVVLAGGFGYYLNPEDAATIGLLPGELVDKTVTGGNTALAGALFLGDKIIQGKDPNLTADIRNREETKVHLINLAQIPEFEKKYLDAINF